MNKADTPVARGRPLSDVARALLTTAVKLSAAGRRVTLAEMASAACVGQQAARHTVANLKRRGHLKIVGERREAHRNRPVAEYMATPEAPEADACTGAAELGRVMSAWAR